MRRALSYAGDRYVRWQVGAAEGGVPCIGGNLSLPPKPKGGPKATLFIIPNAQALYISSNASSFPFGTGLLSPWRVRDMVTKERATQKAA